VALHLRGLSVGPLEENCWLVVDDVAGEAVLVDPGDEADRILGALDASGARLTAIWLTHAHFDHVGAIAAIKRVHDVPVYLHPLDGPLYGFAAQSAARWGLSVEQPPPAERALAEGDTVRVGTLAFTVMHAPGHAPGHVVFHGHGVALSGDCLFAGSIGRSDLPFSNPAHLAASLERIAALPPDTVVHPGHGPTTTIGAELETNPFLSGGARVLGA
jgi:hydroxyacylglutathione hydrolase